MKRSSSQWLRWAAVVVSSLLLCACGTTTRLTSKSIEATYDGLPRPSKEQQAGDGLGRPSYEKATLTLEDDSSVSKQATPAQRGHRVRLAGHAKPKKNAKATQPARKAKATHYGPGLHHPLCRCMKCQMAHHPDFWPIANGHQANDEFIFDGGDMGRRVGVGKNGTIYGLNQEDTVAIYDSKSQGLQVQASNRVPIYAPRFGAVRQIIKLEGYERNSRVADMNGPTGPYTQRRTLGQKTLEQPLPIVSSSGLTTANVLRERNRDMIFETTNILLSLQGKYLPFEDFKVMRFGNFDNSQKARLAARINAAKTWTHEKGLQVTVGRKLTNVREGTTGAKGAHVYEMRPGKPALRIVKVANKQNALPGDTVDFTIRFDNVGTESLNNVIVMDNLSSRLEYVQKSQKSSVKATFGSTVNEGESLVLKWMLDEPLAVGKGGIIRFRCKVR